MSAEELKALRNAAHLNQRQFAAVMGVPLRTYENLESGRVDVRLVHINAAKWAIVELLSGDDLGFVTAPDDIAVIIEQAAGRIS
ncbi:helix-turn-helix domain-containing protein [Agrobacterium fabrum]|uniref:helix-turn-helix domain-containing protein n=1 Tax=Agrobacterium fabrum TaxID=1176649 RepID=UPI0024765FDE|nr:helix-turn-helix domain-containing protein [Agrobacterium fabrum]MDH6294659.1 transcriptional regulator with XRE-family HTH domain [Agrobacterium fabrum]